MKRMFFIFLLCSVFFSIEAKEYKVEEIPLVHLADRTRYVSNPDGILSSSVVKAMDAMLFSLEEQTGIQTLVAVVTAVDGGNCFEFAHRLGQSAGVGQKGRDNGLVVLLSTEDRCVQFVTGYGLEGVLSDALCKRIQQRYMVDYFSEGDWDGGMLEGIRATCGVLDGSMENIAEEDEDVMILYIVLALTVIGVVTVVAVIWRDSRCPNCKKHDIQRVNSRVVGRSNGYITTETTYRCLKCGHIFTRQTTSFDNNYRGPRGGVIVTGGGFGGGRGFSGGSFGGGSFGGGGAGSRF
ncbi:MAG: TPM domain-containing protein [Bacteroidaceae bacterium]|nr:TPM domain-containing protein [Bacteroidaceae bacterium]